MIAKSFQLEQCLSSSKHNRMLETFNQYKDWYFTYRHLETAQNC